MRSQNFPMLRHAGGGLVRDDRLGDLDLVLEEELGGLAAHHAYEHVVLHAALLAIMRSSDELGYSGRLDRISPVVAETFDLPFMAAKSMGRHWKKLPEADQGRWLEIFASHVSANYAGQFTGFSGETFETLGEETAIRDTRVVRTRLTRPKEEAVQLNYRLREVDGDWRIIDIYLNGTVSELALRRSEYSSVLKRQGFEKLLSTIDEKLKDLAGGSTQS